MKDIGIKVAIGLAIVAIVVAVAGWVNSGRQISGLGAASSLAVHRQDTTNIQGNFSVSGILYNNTKGTWVISKALGGNSSTTILSVQNPFPTTSTIPNITLLNTATATSSYTIACGTSTTAYAPSSFTGTIIGSGVVATSTSFDFIQNNLSVANGAVVTGGTTGKILIAPSNYLICQVQNTYSTYWTTSTNAFAGLANVEFQTF